MSYQFFNHAFPLSLYIDIDLSIIFCGVGYRQRLFRPHPTITLPTTNKAKTQLSYLISNTDFQE